MAAVGLSYSVEPGSPVLEVQSLSHWTTREVPDFFFLLLHRIGPSLISFGLVPVVPSSLISVMLPGSWGRVPRDSYHSSVLSFL